MSVPAPTSPPTVNVVVRTNEVVRQVGRAAAPIGKGNERGPKADSAQPNTRAQVFTVVDSHRSADQAQNVNVNLSVTVVPPSISQSTLAPEQQIRSKEERVYQGGQATSGPTSTNTSLLAEDEHQTALQQESMKLQRTDSTFQTLRRQALSAYQYHSQQALPQPPGSVIAEFA